jgi:hypothetical protein
MDVYRAQKEAEDLMIEYRDAEIRFMMNINDIPIFCAWLDPYMGLFRVVGNDGKLSDGFMSINDLPEVDVIDQWVIS